MQVRRYCNRWVIFTLSGILLFYAFLHSFPIRAVIAKATHSDSAELVATLRTTDTLNTRWFWQWRDETNGTFTFDEATTRIGMTRRILQPTTSNWILHRFSSPTVQSSIDEIQYSIYPEHTIVSDLASAFQSEYPIVVASGNDFALLANQNNTKLLLLFAKQTNELIQTDGLFDFIESERSYLEGSYWVNKTYIYIYDDKYI